MAGRRRVAAAIGFVAAAALVANAIQTATLESVPDTPEPPIPLGLPQNSNGTRHRALPIQRPEIVALGAKLFAAKRLSIDGSMSCASCHDPAKAFTTATPPFRESNTAGTRLRRDVPSLLNVAFATPLHHDGREPSLELQILAPLFNASEMANSSFDDLYMRVASAPELSLEFKSVFQSAPNIENIGRALAAYQRSLLAANSPFDRWHFGKSGGSLSQDAERGYELFTSTAGCAACHPIDSKSALFTRSEFLNTGVGFQSEARRAAEHPQAPMDRGREEVTHQRQDRYKFRTPTLRNVELTAPYMHDGSIKSLEEVVAYYNAGGSTDPEKNARIKPLGLSADEQRALVAFLKSLTSESLPGVSP